MVIYVFFVFFRGIVVVGIVILCMLIVFVVLICLWWNLKLGGDVIEI